MQCSYLHEEVNQCDRLDSFDCAGDQIIVHMRARELRVPSLEESDGCTMHMSKGMQKQTAIGPLVQIYLFSPLEDHEILLVLWASD